jgi:hypothetical protein
MILNLLIDLQNIQLFMFEMELKRSKLMQEHNKGQMERAAMVRRHLEKSEEMLKNLMIGEIEEFVNVDEPMEEDVHP